MKKKLLILALLVAGLSAAGWFADRMLKGRSHPGLRTFIHQWWVNYPASFAVEPQVLSIHVEARDLEAIEAVVQAARERGVIMPEGNDYVPSELTFEGQRFKAKLRIKGKMDDHVNGKKWSFRVVAKKDDGFLGMQRFSLQHPGTRNYLCDWFFHRLMKGEGAIALRYGFIRLQFNGEDLGVYAYEEHFGPELLTNNGRLKGPLFRFDPGLFWIHRLNMMQRIRYDEPFGTYQAAALDPFGEGQLEKDSVQRRYFEEAIVLMDGFRRGERSASEVFDADGLAIRHAMLDLVGGHHSMDWSDVKYYYDPALKRIEPVAYESFSAFPIRRLSGSGMYLGKASASMDLHDAYFNDPVVFRAYVHALEKVSRASYLDSAFAALAPALDSASAIVYREFPYKELDRSIYYRNQATIRRILDVPKGFHAYFDGGTDTLNFTIVPIESLPVEVHGVVDGTGHVHPPSGNAIVPIRPASDVGTPMRIKVPLSGAAMDGSHPIVLRYSVLGASVMKELEVFPYAFLDDLEIPAFASSDPSSPLPSFIAVDQAHLVMSILPGTHVLDTDLFLPAGYTVMAAAGTRIELLRGARIISRSPFDWSGVEDEPIVIGSSDASGGGIVLLSKEESRWTHIRLSGFGANKSRSPALLLVGGGITMTGCTLGEVRERDIVLAVRGRISITASSFTGGSDQLTLAYCTTSVISSDFNGAGDDAIAIKGGSVSADRVAVHMSIGNGIKLDEFAEAEVKGTTVTSGKDALAVSEGARVNWEGGILSSTKGTAVNVQKEHTLHGPSHVKLGKVDLGDVAEPIKVGKGNKVTLNGSVVGVTIPAKQ